MAVLTAGMVFGCLGFPGRGNGQTTGSIQGMARDVNGAAISNVTVTLSCDCRECGASPPCSSCCPLSSTVTVHTSDDGEFRFTSIPIGTYMITGEAPGFATLTQNGVRVQPYSANVINLEFRPGSLDTTVSISSTTIPTVIGTVIDVGSQKPVADATVIVSQRTCDCRRECPKDRPCDSCCPYRRENSASTNEKGEFTIDLEPGDYNFRIETGAITKDEQRRISSKATQRIKIHVYLPPHGTKH